MRPSERTLSNIAFERDAPKAARPSTLRSVPVAALFENIEDGAQVTQFVEWFPGVSIDQVRAVLDHAARSALATA